MTNKLRMYVPDYYSYASPWLKLFGLVEEPKDADVILFTGGADIDPAFYGQKMGYLTSISPNRDRYEKKLFDFGVTEGKKFLGICRGAQLLCALDGGRLAQHVNGHQQGFSGAHRITTSEGKDDLLVNSVHHQMMIPKEGNELLAWAEKLSDVYLDGDDEEIEGIDAEPEVVYFPRILGLGIQCHPEAMGNPKYKSSMDYFYNLVEERLM